MMLPAIWHYGNQRLAVWVVGVYPVKNSICGAVQLAVLYSGNIRLIESGPRNEKVTVFTTESERATWLLQHEFGEKAE